MDNIDNNKALVTIIWEGSQENDTIPEGPYPLPEPTSYSGTTSTMIDSGTSVNGKLLGSVIRSNVAQVSLSWNYLTAEDWKTINQLFNRQYINLVEFFDQTINGWATKKMYISDRNAGMWRRDSNGNVLGWAGCSLQLTEV